MPASLASGGEHFSWVLNYDREAIDQAMSLGGTWHF
jgi:hypothetical protein